MDRLISEQTVFKIIDSLKANFTCYDSVTLDEVASHVKAIPSADEDEWVKRSDVLKVIDKCVDEKLSEPNWIPVSERLPEERKAVLVYAPEYKNIYCAYLDGNTWFIFGGYGSYAVSNVTAWMPLPTSYEQERSDRE